MSWIQPYTENTCYRKLKVDKMMQEPYIPVVDICLLSFGYRVFGTAP